MPLFDWKCESHGVFEASHAICPALGCASKSVEKIFLKAPGFKSDLSKRIDASTRKTADMHNLNDIRAVRPGESSFGGHLASGKEVLWGDDINRVSKVSMPELVKQAAQPFVMDRKDGTKETVLPGMYLAAKEAGLTNDKHKLPPIGEKTVSAQEQKHVKAVKRATS